MKIDSILTPEHYLQPHLSAVRHSRQVAISGALLAALSATAFWGHFSFGPAPRSFYMLFSLVILFSTVAFICILRAPREFIKALRQGHYDLYLGPTSITLEAACFSTETPHGKETSSYSSITKITAYKNLISLIINVHEGYLIPLSSFESTQQLHEFITILLEKTDLELSPLDRSMPAIPFCS